MKMQTSVIFVKKFKTKYLKDKNFCKVGDDCLDTGEYRGAAHSICSLKYSVPKKNPIVFHNESHYDYHFIIKELANGFKKQFSCLGQNIEKYITITIPIEKEITRIDKGEEEIRKIYLTHYNLLIVQDLWQAHYQVLSITFLKEFIELNVNTDTMIKNVNLRN